MAFKPGNLSGIRKIIEDVLEHSGRYSFALVQYDCKFPYIFALVQYDCKFPYIFALLQYDCKFPYSVALVQ